MRTAGEGEDRVRRRAFGDPYVTAISRLRRAIPAREPYLLTQIADPLDPSYLWARFDLLPRRAILAPHAQWAPRDCLEAQIRWRVVVVPARAREPLVLLRRDGTRPPGCPPAPWSTELAP